MAKIGLRRSRLFALVNHRDLPILRRLKWRLNKSKHTNYAIANISVEGMTTTVYMHRYLLNAKPGEIVDHRDGNGLNNRRRNIRKTNQSVNMLNRHFKTPGLSSKFVGVSYNKEKRKFKAYLQVDGQLMHVGYFPTEYLANLAYKAKRKEFGL